MPSVESLDLIPRRGANAVIDYPFHRLGEIDGFVTTLGEDGSVTDQGLGNIPVRLVDPETGEELERTHSEFDGYYIFSSLGLGRYEVQASYGWFDEEGVDTITRAVEQAMRCTYGWA